MRIGFVAKSSHALNALSASTEVGWIAEMSIGLDLDWTGSGLWRIFLNLNWIRTAKCFINLGSGPDLDWINGK